jgi:hypothetical protein
MRGPPRCRFSYVCSSTHSAPQSLPDVSDLQFATSLFRFRFRPAAPAPKPVFHAALRSLDCGPHRRLARDLLIPELVGRQRHEWRSQGQRGEQGPYVRPGILFAAAFSIALERPITASRMQLFRAPMRASGGPGFQSLQSPRAICPLAQALEFRRFLAHLNQFYNH